jgi:hypothetical protein
LFVNGVVFGEFESHTDGVYSIQHYVINLVSDLRHVGGFLTTTI